MRSAPSKTMYIRKRKFQIFPLDYSIVERAYIGWYEQPTAVTCEEFKLFVYSVHSFIWWCRISSVFARSFNRKWNYPRVQGLEHNFPARYKLHEFLGKVSPGTNSVWLPDFDDLSISVDTIYFSECWLILYFFGGDGKYVIYRCVEVTNCTH